MQLDQEGLACRSDQSERPVSISLIAESPRRAARTRTSAPHSHAACTAARPSPIHTRRIACCESDQALSIALDRMIDQILRERAGAPRKNAR